MNLQYVSVPGEYEDDPDNLPKPFRLSLPFEEGWKHSKKKALVVIETVPGDDIRAGGLLSQGRSRDLVFNTLEQATKAAARYHKKPTPAMRQAGYIDPSEWKFSFINFNNRRWFNLAENTQEKLINLAAARVLSFVKRIKPDLVIIMGDTAARELTEFGNNVPIHRGRLTKIVGTEVPAVTTLDAVSVEPAREDDSSLPLGAVVKPNILGFVSRNVVTGLLGTHPHSVSHVKVKPKLVSDIFTAKRMFQELRRAPVVALDLETTSLDTSNVDVLTAQFAVDEKSGWVLPVYHPDNPWSNKEQALIKKWLKDWLGRHVEPGDTSQYIIGQNIGYDMRVLQKWLSIRYWHIPVWDLMCGEFVLDENVKMLKQLGNDSVFDLRQIGAYYDSDYFYRAEFTKEDRNRVGNVELVEGAPVVDYCAADVQYPFALHKEQIRRAFYMPQGRGNYRPKYVRLMLNHMSAMVNVAATMRYRGTQVDQEYMLKILAGTEDFAILIKEKLAEFRALPDVKEANAIARGGAGIPDKGFFGKDDSDKSFVLDMGKPDHRKLLFVDVAGLEPLKIGKSGKPSFNKQFMEEYKEVDCVKVYQEYNKMRHLHTSFIVPFTRLMAQLQDNKHDGRVHPNFGLVNTWTGRSNSSGPSLQQIPEHGPIAAYIKRMLIARMKHLHLECDYSQFEVRCLAMLSGDAALRDMVHSVHDAVMEYRIKQTAAALAKRDREGDFHKMNYSFFTGVPIQEVTKEQRQAAKGIIFGVMYGMGNKSLAVLIKRTEGEADEIMGIFYGRYQDAKAYLDRQTEIAQRNLHTMSPLGRRRNLFAYLSSMNQLRSAQDRRAQNSEIQGVASDICYDAANLFAYNMNSVMTRLHPTLVETPFSNGSQNAANSDYLPFGANAIVHDSIKSDVSFNTLFLTMHIMEHSMTKGVVDLVERQFGWKMDVPLDVEVDIGTDWSRKRTWNGGRKHLDEIVRMALADHRDVYGTEAVPNIDRTVAKMKKAYRYQRTRLDLDTAYPLPHPLPIAA